MTGYGPGLADDRLMAAIHLVRLGAVRGVSAPLSLAFPGVNNLDSRLGAELSAE